MMWCVSGVSGVCSEITVHSRASVFGVGVFDPIFFRPLGRGEWIVSQHAHPEAAENLRGRFADFAGAENAGGFAMQIEADQPVEGKIQIAHAVVGARDLAIEREQERDRVLRHRIGRIGRDARDGEAQLGRRVQIDVVKPGTTQRDMFHA